jgi:hypothetical protein
MVVIWMDAALGHGQSDRHEPIKRKQARGSTTLHSLLHVLAEMAHLGLRVTVGEIDGAGRYHVQCSAYGGYILGSNHGMGRVCSGKTGASDE